MTKHKISVLGVSDTRRKGTGCKEIHSNFVLTWSGVKKEEWAKHGVGFIIQPNVAKDITNIDYISERLIKVRILKGTTATNYIQAYAPCNDSYTDIEKNDFFEQLSDCISLIPDEENMVVMGDLNGRVGRRRDPWNKYLGPHSHNTEANDNGLQILGLCAEHDLVITNTLFEHRESQISTWYKWNDLNISSQIDYIIVKSSQRAAIKDSKAKPNISLDTDHRPVLMWLTEKKKIPFQSRQPKSETEQILLYKLNKNEDTRRKYEETVTEALRNQNIEQMTSEESWCFFRDTLVEALKATCGTRKRGPRKKKATPWWNDEVKEGVKEKKRLFKQWVKSKREEDHKKYKSACKKCKSLVKKSKDDSWKDYGEKLNDLCKKSPREFYKSVKAMRLRDEPFNPIMAINDQDGNPIYEDENVKQRWENYFKGLLNPSVKDNTQNQFKPRYEDQEEPNIIKDEVMNALKYSPKNKAAGIDQITNEAIIASGETGITWLTTIFQKAWQERKVPEDWQKAIVVPIWKKKGNKKDCSTYRGISLLSHAGKIYAKILEQRIRAKAEALLSDAQFGFRKGRGCTDAIFALRQLSEKACEYQKNLNMVFIDQEKAFDRVNRDQLWEVLEQYGVRGQLLDNIRAMYRNSESAVQTSTGLTKWFNVHSGVRQGCVLSPLLFVIYMDKITKEANPNPESLNELLFADDQSIIHQCKEDLQEHLNNLDMKCNEYGMRISIEKTEVMSVGRTPESLEMFIKDQKLKQTREFKYLGSVFSEDGKIDREIETRIQKANSVNYQLSPLLKHPNIPMETKAKLIDTIFVPTLTYQCQTWPLNLSHKSKITTCEMRCLRKAAGKTRRDHIRNEVIREMVGTTPVLQFIDRQKIKWFGHLIRMPTNQPALRAYTMRHSGFRARGRPRRRWSDDVTDTLRAHGMNLTRATELAKDRRLHLPATPTGTSGRIK